MKNKIFILIAVLAAGLLIVSGCGKKSYFNEYAGVEEYGETVDFSGEGSMGMNEETSTVTKYVSDTTGHEGNLLGDTGTQYIMATCDFVVASSTRENDAGNSMPVVKKLSANETREAACIRTNKNASNCCAFLVTMDPMQSYCTIGVQCRTYKIPGNESHQLDIRATNNVTSNSDLDPKSAMIRADLNRRFINNAWTGFDNKDNPVQLYPIDVFITPPYDNFDIVGKCDGSAGGMMKIDLAADTSAFDHLDAANPQLNRKGTKGFFFDNASEKGACDFVERFDGRMDFDIDMSEGGKVTSIVFNPIIHKFALCESRVPALCPEPGASGDYTAQKSDVVDGKANVIGAKNTDISALTVSPPVGGFTFENATIVKGHTVYLDFPDLVKQPGGVTVSAAVDGSYYKVLVANAWSQVAGEAFTFEQHAVTIMDVGNNKYIQVTPLTISGIAAYGVSDTFLKDSLSLEIYGDKDTLGLPGGTYVGTISLPNAKTAGWVEVNTVSGRFEIDASTIGTNTLIFGKDTLSVPLDAQNLQLYMPWEWSVPDGHGVLTSVDQWDNEAMATMYTDGTNYAVVGLEAIDGVTYAVAYGYLAADAEIKGAMYAVPANSLMAKFALTIKQDKSLKAEVTFDGINWININTDAASLVYEYAGVSQIQTLPSSATWNDPKTVAHILLNVNNNANVVFANELRITGFTHPVQMTDSSAAGKSLGI